MDLEGKLRAIMTGGDHTPEERHERMLMLLDGLTEIGLQQRDAASGIRSIPLQMLNAYPHLIYTGDESIDELAANRSDVDELERRAWNRRLREHHGTPIRLTNERTPQHIHDSLIDKEDRYGHVLKPSKIIPKTSLDARGDYD